MHYTPHTHPWSASQSGRVQTLGDVLPSVYAMIEADAFDDAARPIAEEIALIVAEIFCLQESAAVRIGGEHLPVRAVQDAFSRLTNEHVQAVICRFEAIPYEVKHVKTYLRTALYNSVFELSARAANAYAKDRNA